MVLGYRLTITGFLIVTGLSGAFCCEFGETCKQKCPEKCRHLPSDDLIPLCHPSTGDCINGCKEGWWDSKCQEKCNINCKGQICLQTGQCIDGCVEGYFGDTCSDRCNPNCLYQSCLHNGTCTHGCVDGHYGDDCVLTCGINCLSQRCESVPSLGTYKCIDGCVDGWKGGTCQQKCPVHCVSCHFQVEGCTACESGWTGHYCNKPVLDQCKTIMDEDGNCTGGCHDGFKGLRCEQKCPDFCLRCEQMGDKCTVCHPGRYGPNCEKFCAECEQDICLIETGDCTIGKKHEATDMCQQHSHLHSYNSSHCAKHQRHKRHIVECRDHCKTDDCSVCDLGWFGDRCRQFCPSNCYEGCDIGKGDCNGCRPNYYGQTCEVKCPDNCRQTESGDVACDEVTGQCLSGCIPGFYGWTCNITCPAHCEANICTQSSGKCSQGCTDGLVWMQRFKSCKPSVALALVSGSNPDEPSVTCQEQYYGMNCENNCSSSCIASSCTSNETANKVVCRQGCIDGKFGPYCENRCPAECERCDDYDHCSECRPGFHGPVCTELCSLVCNGCRCHQNGSCSEGCVSGHYGGNCSKHCGSNCLRCHQWSGRCITCKSNWCGENCDRPCYSCRFGICARDDGNCPFGCNPGLDGPICNDSAHSNTRPCFKSEGPSQTIRAKRHACEYGCLTSECSQCLDGFYGTSCEKRCPDNCEGTCHKIDGHCDYDCKERFWGPYCNWTCPENCNEGCNQTSGNCHGGCKRRWHGSRCNEKCPERCHPDVCYQDTGKCTQGCIDGWQGDTCDMPCSKGCRDQLCFMDGNCQNGCNLGFTGGFGKCSVSCNPNCLGNECSISEDRNRYHCSKGCVDGYAGYLCVVRCADNCSSCNQENFSKCKNCSCHHFGRNCQDQCNPACLNTSCPVCSGEGVCNEGCIDGHWGEKCQHQCRDFCSTCNTQSGKCTQCKSGRYGSKCELNCGHCSQKECYKGSGICKYGCIDGYRGNTCVQPKLEVTALMIVNVVGCVVLLLVSYALLFTFDGCLPCCGCGFSSCILCISALDVRKWQR